MRLIHTHIKRFISCVLVENFYTRWNFWLTNFFLETRDDFWSSPSSTLGWCLGILRLDCIKEEKRSLCNANIFKSLKNFYVIIFNYYFWISIRATEFQRAINTIFSMASVTDSLNKRWKIFQFRNVNTT